MMQQKEILKNRAEAKRKQLEARLAELKADARETAANEIELIRTRLDALAEATRRGWDNLTEALAGRINEIIGEPKNDERDSEPGRAPSR